MKYERKRVMRVPIIDHDNMLYEMLLENKQQLNAAHKFYRNRLRIISTIEDDDRKYKATARLKRLIYKYANSRLKIDSKI